MWDEETIKRKYYELNAINEEVKKISSELNNISKTLVNLENIKSWIDEVSSLKENTETLVPISDGIFVKAKLFSSPFIVNVGANTLVNKNSSDIFKMLDDQKKSLKNYQEQLNKTLIQYDSAASTIEEEFMKLDKER